LNISPFWQARHRINCQKESLVDAIVREAFGPCNRLLLLTNGASSKRKFGDAHLERIRFRITQVKQIQEDVEYRHNLSQAHLCSVWVFHPAET